MNASEWEYVAPRESSLIVYFDLQCRGVWATYLATSSLFIGWAVGSPFISHVTDKYGRKSVVFPSLFVIIIFGFLSIFSPNFYVFIAAQFIVGLFLTGNFHTLFVLLGEFVDSQYRPVVINAVLSVYSVWISLLCLAAYFIRDWRLLTTITTLPFLVGFLFYKFIPESLHWLQTQNRPTAFDEVVGKIAYWNGTQIPGNSTCTPPRETSAEGSSPKVNPCDLFGSCDMLWRSLRLCYMWFTTGLLFFGLSMSASNLTGSIYRDFVLIILVEIPANVLTAFLCQRIGRKKTVWINAFVGSLCCIAVAFVPQEGNIQILRLLLGVFGKFSITMALNTYYLWTMELYSTHLRANGLGLGNIACRMGGALAPWISKGLMYYSEMAPYVVMGSLGIVTGFVAVSLPETAGKILDGESIHIDDVEQSAMESH